MELDLEQKEETAEKETLDMSEEDFTHYSLMRDFKISYRYLRKRVSSFLRKQLKKDFKLILYISESDFSKEFIISLMRQYPDKKITVLIPIFEESKGLKKYSHSFEFFVHNKKFSAQIYQLPKEKDNIEVLGLYSEAYTKENACNNSRELKFLAPFMKAVRIAAKIIKPDMIHSNNLPFFLGAEFELGIYPISVFQQINDFSELSESEPFWTVLNIADKKGLVRLSKDKTIQKCVSTLLNQRKIRNYKKILECLNFIYSNYMDFRARISKDAEINENVIFEILNQRTLKLFPQIVCKNNPNYLPWYYTIKRADFWAVISKTYYQDLYGNPELSYGMFERISDTNYKSGYISIGHNKKEERIKFPFDSENFREERKLNKEYLQKEFSQERLRTKFTDQSLFKNDELKVDGYLDPFFSAPLLFLKLDKNNSFEEIKTAITTVLKLFELNRVIRIIINYDGQFVGEYLKTFIDFCKYNTSLNGRWVFLTGELNLPQFLSASDMIMLPAIKNPSDSLLFKAIELGCVPIVTKNGIYNDNVFEILDNMTLGCGFKTDENINITTKNSEELYIETVNKALNFYTQNSSSWNLLIKNMLNYDTSWNFKTIEKYNQIYEELV